MTVCGHAFSEKRSATNCSVTEVSETITPDSTKSNQQKFSEGVTDAGDKVARYVTQYSGVPDTRLTNTSGFQGDGSKSTTQEASDKLGRSKDDHAHGGSGGGIVDSMKSAVGMDKK